VEITQKFCKMFPDLEWSQAAIDSKIKRLELKDIKSSRWTAERTEALRTLIPGNTDMEITHKFRETFPDLEWNRDIIRSKIKRLQQKDNNDTLLVKSTRWTVERAEAQRTLIPRKISNGSVLPGSKKSCSALFPARDKSDSRLKRVGASGRCMI
jgi:hypothetical protein